jgi:putative transposase
MDNGFGLLRDMLAYKLEKHGGRLVKIDRFYPSSQLCHDCGYKNTDTKNLSVREWDCSQCGVHHDRDVNAALNIRDEGKRLIS